MTSVRVLAILAIFVCLAGCRKPAVATYDTAPVILISVDTLRADRIGAYGYAGARTPWMDRLAREGIRFDGAYSHVPLTLPGHAALFTGRLPPHNGVRDNLGFTLAAGQKTLATRFKEKGVATGGAVSAYVLRHQTGIGQGFDFYEDALVIEGSLEAVGTVQRDGSVAVEALAKWVEGQPGKRVFAFLHLYEPHSPYAPPEGYRDLPSAYDGDVAYADALIGRFLDRLRSAGVLDNAIVVLTADHGEGLGDHGEGEHGIFLYREALHVPLIVRLPGGVRGGTVVDGTVAQVDVPATILDLAGLPAGGLDGVSLRGAINTGKTAGAPVYSETLYPKHQFGWSDLYSVTEGRLRYIRAPRPEVYDLGSDPGEKKNVVSERSAAVGPMNAFLDRIAASGEPARPTEVDAEVREKLAALGYVGLTSKVPPAGDLPDPKDKIASHEDYRQALVLRQEGKSEEAVARLRRVVAGNPRMVEAWMILGTTLGGLGRNAEAIAALVKALEVDPERPEIHVALAKIYAIDGRLDKALPHAEIASAKNPASGSELVAQILTDAGKAQQAAVFARRSIAADDEQVMAHFILGDIARRAQRYDEALGHYRRAEAAKERRKQTIVRNLYYNMGDCLARLGRNEEAEAMFKRELQQIPTSRDARLALALLYRSEGRDAEVRTVLDELVAAEKPPTAEAYAVVLRTLTMLGDREGARAVALRAQQAFPADRRFR
jgi:tetratricopeptide (TPR) repeat protein